MTTIANSQAQIGLANDQRSTQDLHDKARQIDSLQSRLIPAVDKDKKLRAACEGFETIFVKKMWEEMQATVQESDFLKGKDEKHWRSMYNQEIAETLSKAGGIGLADMMYRQLSSNLANATRASVATSFKDTSAGFELKPVPLINLSDTAQPYFAKNNDKINNNINDNILASTTLGAGKNNPQDEAASTTQNSRSLYSGEINQPKAPNMEEINNQSIKNVNNVVQNVLEQLKSQKNKSLKASNNNSLTDAQLITAAQEQKNAPNSMYSANVASNQQNHIFQQSSNTQPLRANAYTQPLVNKLGAGTVLPNPNAYSQTANTEKINLPKPASIHQAYVNGNPGISASKYVHNSPFIVKPSIAKKIDENNNAQALPNSSTQVASNNSVSQGMSPNLRYTNTQIDQMGQAQNSLARQNINILPSERKTNSI